MSSQKNILKNLMKNGGVASTAALMMLASSSSLGAALINRTTIGPATLSTGAGLDQNGLGGNMPFASTSTNPMVLTVDDSDVTVDVPAIYAIYAKNAKTLVIGQNTVIGAIGGAATNISYNGNTYTVTLNGAGVGPADTKSPTPIPDGSTSKNAAGALSKFGPAAPGLLMNSYGGLNQVDFGGGTGILEIATLTPNKTVTSGTYGSEFDTVLLNAENATLNVRNTKVDNGPTVHDLSFTDLKAIYLQGAVTYRLIPNAPGDFDAYPTNLTINFDNTTGADTRYGIASSDQNNVVTFNAGHTIESTNNGVINDAVGTVAFNAGATGIAIGPDRIVEANVGTSISKRLASVQIVDIEGGSTGIITVNGTMFAKTILLATNYNKGNGIIWTSDINTGDNGMVAVDNQSVVLFQSNVTSDINFISKSATVVTMDDGYNVTGNIYNSQAGTGVATLNFAGNSLVTGDIGTSGTIDILNVQGNNTQTANLQGDVTVNKFNFIQNGVGVVGGTLTATTGVNFNNLGAILGFNGATGGVNPANYTFSSPVLNQNIAQITVDTNLIVTDPSIANMGMLAIGVVGKGDGTLTVTVPVPGNALVLNSQIAINTAGSQLVIAPTGTQAVTFSKNVVGPGIVNLVGSGANLLTVQGDANAATLGTAGAKLAQLNIQGNVTALGGVGTVLDLSNTNQLNIQGGSIFTDNSLTSTNTLAINIGKDGGVATYALDAVNGVGGAFNLNTGGMTFGNAASILQLQSSAAAGNNTTITLLGNLDPGNAGGNAGTGIVTINAINANEMLKIGGAGSLGIAGGNLLQQMTFSGAGNITVVPTINTANAILTGIAGDLILNNVNAPINFTNTTNLTVSNVTGKIDFANNAGFLNIANDSTVTGAIDSTVDSSGTINFGSNTTVTGAVGATNAITLANFNAGGNVNLNSTSNATNFSIGNNTNVTAGDLMTGAVNFALGAGTLVLQNGLDGAITTAAADNGIVTINGGGVSGTITGTNLVNIGATPVTFSANVSSTSVALTNNASVLTVGSGVTLTSDVTTANPNNGILILNPNSSVIGDIGTNLSAIAAVQIGAGSASLQRGGCFN